jgi:hypothetical protein
MRGRNNPAAQRGQDAVAGRGTRSRRASASRIRPEDSRRTSGQKRREALGSLKRLLYCVNVNRTSLDHLLLGKNADVDQMSNDPSIARDRRYARTSAPSSIFTFPTTYQDLDFVVDYK